MIFSPIQRRVAWLFGLLARPRDRLLRVEPDGA